MNRVSHPRLLALGAAGLAALALWACGDDDDVNAGDAAQRDAAPDARSEPGPLDAAALDATALGGDGGAGTGGAGTGGAGTGGAPPVDGGADSAVTMSRCPAGDANDAGGDDTPAIALELPREPRPGTPFVLAINVADRWSGDAVVCIDGQMVALVHVYRGRGSVTLALGRAGTAELAVHTPSSSIERTVTAAERPLRRLTGALTGDDLQWTADADVEVSGDVLVAAGESLVIARGSRVLLAANAALEISGELQVLGAADDPVVFARAGSEPWGGIRVLPGGHAQIEHAWLGGGGGDASRIHGHSDSQPLLWVDSATAVFTGGGIVDNPGKALGSTNAQLTVRDALISRCDTGGELGQSALTMERTHVLETPDADGQFDDDDNDGIYLLAAYAGSDGVIIPTIIRDSVFALGEDDAIDHNNAEVRIERVWIDGFRHEGLAASSGRSATIVDSVVRNCGQGIEAGYGTPRVEVDHCLVTDNGVGLRFGDSYSRTTNGTLTVRNTIAYGNEDNAHNHVNALAGPLEGALTITCSAVDDASFDGMNGNFTGPPQLDLAAGCATGPATVAPECDGTFPGPRMCW